MAGHLEIDKAIEIDDTKYLQKAKESILKRLHFAASYRCGSLITRCAVNQDLRIFGKKFMRLPDEYAAEDTDQKVLPLGNQIRAFYVGSYRVSQKMVHGGMADFELHYNPVTEKTTIYMVA